MKTHLLRSILRLSRRDNVRAVLLAGARPLLMIGTLIALASCVSTPPPTTVTKAPPTRPKIGLMLMAHGGDDAWNKNILDAVDPIQREMPVEVAFGMATPTTIQEAAEKLQRRGAKRIVVVRLFISGDSFLDRTEQILGLTPGAPARPSNALAAMHDHSGHDHGSMPLWKVDVHAEFVVTRNGLMDADSMSQVLADRAAILSRQPVLESILVIGHGPESDAENARWLARMNKLADAIRMRAPFRDVRVETLREDWPERRQQAESRIRSYIKNASNDGGKAIVIPFRVSGFGPYAKVLEGLDYVADEKGLLPSKQVTEWIGHQAKEAALRAGWIGKGDAWP
jgi:sirohydrochlorin cobaltochelatase